MRISARRWGRCGSHLCRRERLRCVVCHWFCGVTIPHNFAEHTQCGCRVVRQYVYERLLSPICTCACVRACVNNSSLADVVVVVVVDNVQTNTHTLTEHQHYVRVCQHNMSVIRRRRWRMRNAKRIVRASAHRENGSRTTSSIMKMFAFDNMLCIKNTRAKKTVYSIIH